MQVYMDFKRKYIKYKTKYLELKKQVGGAKTKMPDNFIHTMSITKAVVGILYNVYQESYPRDDILFQNITYGNALNMNSGLKDGPDFGNEWGWDFEDFMNNVESNSNLFKYSEKRLSLAEKINRFEYNNLIYQMLASKLGDAAEKLSKFMREDNFKKDMKKYVHYTDEKGNQYEGYYKEGNGWKWHYTKRGEALGPNGFYMTKEFAKRFAEKVKEIVIRQPLYNKQKVPLYKDYKWTHNVEDVLKYYWNGWWFSDKCAYAIGYIFQYIAITPNSTNIQIYHDTYNFDDYEIGSKFYDKSLFIKNLEESFLKLKHLPGGKRSGLLNKNLVDMVKNKEAVFYLDKAYPENFSIGIKQELERGQGWHIHAIFKEGEEFYISGEKFIHKGSKNMLAFVKIIEDKKGNEWVIYDHNKDPELDVHLINSFPKK